MLKLFGKSLTVYLQTSPAEFQKKKKSYKLMQDYKIHSYKKKKKNLTFDLTFDLIFYKVHTHCELDFLIRHLVHSDQNGITKHPIDVHGRMNVFSDLNLRVYNADS